MKLYIIQHDDGTLGTVEHGTQVVLWLDGHGDKLSAKVLAHHRQNYLANPNQLFAMVTIINAVLANGDNITMVPHDDFEIMTVQNTNGDTLATMVFVCDSNNNNQMDVLSDYTYNDYTERLLNSVYKTLNVRS